MGGAGLLGARTSCDVLLLRLPARRPRGSKRTEWGMLWRFPPLSLLILSEPAGSWFCAHWAFLPVPCLSTLLTSSVCNTVIVRTNVFTSIFVQEGVPFFERYIDVLSSILLGWICLFGRLMTISSKFGCCHATRVLNNSQTPMTLREIHDCT